MGRVVVNRVSPFSSDSPSNRWGGVLTHTHTYERRAAADPRNDPPGCDAVLADWCRRHGVRAVGTGSPYMPETAEIFACYGGTDEGRERYYAGGVDREALCCREQLADFLRRLNAAAAGDVRFYLDNETPKGRFGHLWWIGYTCEFPPWHDYDHPFTRWTGHVVEPGDTRDEPMPYLRRPYRQIVANQRAGGGLGVWAHPTSWWFSGEGANRRFITNIAAEMPAHVFADGFLDGLVVMGYHAWRPEYLALWQALLDDGYRVTAFAEMDCSLFPTALDRIGECMRSCIAPTDWTDEAIVTEFRAGRSTLSSGPLLALTVDGRPMGAVVETSDRSAHRIVIDAQPAPGQSHLGCIELVGPGGEVLWRTAPGQAGRYDLTLAGIGRRGYCYARAFGEGLAAAPSEKASCPTAITNPVYLHPADETFTPGMTTDVTIRWRDETPWHGGTVAVERADGTLMEEHGVEGAGFASVAPAGGRLRFRHPDGREVAEYLFNVNPALAEVERYLYRGRFLRDFDVTSGEVPLAAWRLDDHRAALRELVLER